MNARIEKIYIDRIKLLNNEIAQKAFFGSCLLNAEFIHDPKNPIPYNQMLNSTFSKIEIGQEWSKVWGNGWFKFTGSVPKEFEGKTVDAHIDINGEACVFENGTPVLGLTHKQPTDHHVGKTIVNLFKSAKAGQKVEILIEAAANGLFGKGWDDSHKYILRQAELKCFDEKHYKLDIDMKILMSIAEDLPEKSIRRKRIIHNLNKLANIYSNGKGIEEALQITANLLAVKASDEELIAYSVGHAHIDLAWLWHVDETKRKAGRTFATALQLIEEYPEYIFGASQPQMYDWVKQDYPELYKKVKQAVKDDKWELQGGMWCEPDMNIPSGESLVRQCLYGKKFFEQEFGIDVKHLWLPDVFGYSAALPQILQLSDIDVFMTQKISWNEVNEFPHHTFMWKGLDGTEIKTHFLPTNDYNLSNWPHQLRAAQYRYKQPEVTDGFLNLYGIGDGGGGPSKLHIEMGKRQQNTLGTPKFKFCKAEHYFDKLRKIDENELPKWDGELYLEFHRGTYTTQGLIKKYNRQSELMLKNVEFLACLISNPDTDKIEEIWKSTLLNQFHDILPGSSINRVYTEAHELAENNLNTLAELQIKSLSQIFDCKSKNAFVVFNFNGFERTEVIKIKSDKHYKLLLNETELTSVYANGFIYAKVTLPSFGYITIKKAEEIKKESKPNFENTVKTIENNLVKIDFDDNGCIESIFDKELDKQMLTGKANVLNMYEDKPNNWEAWDINHYYSQTTPEKPLLISSKLLQSNALFTSIELCFEVGKSTIKQVISLEENSKLIKFDTEVDWKESKKMLRVEAETSIKATEANYETQYGIIKRPNHINTSWDFAKFEVCGHRFADLSQADCGFAIINDSKYGHSCLGNKIGLTLLRSPKMPDEEADMRVHTFSYAYLPHANNLENSDVLFKAHNFNSMPVVFETDLQQTVSQSYINIKQKSSVIIDCIKPSEDKNGIIIRMYEALGKDAKISLDSKLLTKNVSLCNLLENEIEQNIDTENLKFKPFEIKTIKVK